MTKRCTTQISRLGEVEGWKETEGGRAEWE